MENGKWKMENGKWKMENDFSVNKQKWSSRRSRPKMQKKCAESGLQSPAENLYLCRSRNGKVEETAENAKNARNRGCSRRQKIYIYAEAGMAKLKKHPKMQKCAESGLQSPAENLYLCRSRNGKVEETAENAKKCAESGGRSPAENLYLCRSRNVKVEETAENAKKCAESGVQSRQQIYIYAEAGMAKLKKHPKMQKTGVDEVAAKSRLNLFTATFMTRSRREPVFVLSS